MTRSAPLWARRAAISATLPRPANSPASGRLRRAMTTSVISAPAERASALSSATRSAGSPSPKSSSTSSARSPPVGRSNTAPHAGRAAAAGRSRPRNLCSFALVLVRHRDGASRHHGRDGVLVHHLRDGVLQQDDILVERLDLSLELDAVHQVDRNLNVLLAQGVQEGVL